MLSQLTILPSAARTATVTSPDYTLGHCGYGLFTLDFTAVPGVDTVTVKVQGKDTTSGKYYDVLVGTAVSATSTVQLEIGPSIPASANAKAQTWLPETFRVVATHSAGTSFTYSVGLAYSR
jgi:hypothetical protein